MPKREDIFAASTFAAALLAALFGLIVAIVRA